MSINLGPISHVIGSALANMNVLKASGPSGSSLGTFNTEMLQLDISGSNGSTNVLLRESPTLASPGQTTISDIGGGNFRIDSFFDVFTELSLDNGATWIPSTGSTRLSVSSVPEPSSLTIFGLGLLGLFATRIRQCRRRLPS
jgi:hypothetical protein